MKTIKCLFSLFIFCFSLSAFAKEVNSEQAKNASQEKIVAKSPSGRIFLFTNKNSDLNEGDFFTAILGTKALARFLTVRQDNGRIAAKIIKVYSLKNLSMAKKMMTLKLYRGDDALLFAMEKEKENKQDQDSLSDESRILSEDDLFNGSSLDGPEIKERKNRRIKTDHILALNLGVIRTATTSGETGNYTEFGGHYSYQFFDNIWVSLGYGQSVLKGFPAEDIDSLQHSFSIKASYIFEAPFQSYIGPYIGGRMVKIISDDAGQAGTNEQSSDELQNEKDLVADAEKTSLIFGATLLKRLVPGWFITANIGNDALNVGIALEF